MLWPCGETLAFIEPHVPREIVAPPTFARLYTLAALLPDALSSYYVECRLAAKATQVDFLPCVAADPGGRERWARPRPPAGRFERLRGHALWQRVDEFVTDWADPASPLYTQVPLVWLEFDHLEEPPATIPLPSFWWSVGPEYDQEPEQPGTGEAMDLETYRQVTDRAFALLLGRALPPATQRDLWACFGRLPAGGRIIHVSVMFTRRPVCVKVYGVVPSPHFVTYLEHIGWPGSRPEVAALLATFCTAATTDSNTFFDVTIEESLTPKLGIAFSQLQLDTLPDRDPTRRRLWDLWVEAGLCTPEKREALVRWPGSFRATFSGQAWPTRVHKWVDAKLVYQPGAALEAKAYLGFMPSFSLF